jgi:uncharacterized Zn finger protein
MTDHDGHRHGDTGDGAAQHEPTWVERWHALLGGQDADVRRFNQGRAFQRSGRVSGVRVDPGRVVGQVQGSRATPYLVEGMIPVLDDGAWRVVLELVGGQVRHAAKLLAGQPPEGLDAELRERGIDLFASRDALDARCACGEADRPCAHVVALWHELGDRIAEDPFVLLRLRGRGRDRLLAELAAARRRGGGPEQEGIDPATLDVSSWTRAPREAADLEVGPGTVPGTPAGPLRVLGDPPGWSGNVSAWDLFGPAVGAAAARAERL